MVETGLITSFYKELGANECFDLRPRVGRSLVINNPNQNSVFIWVGDLINVQDYRDADDYNQGIAAAPKVDLDSITEPNEFPLTADEYKDFIRANGIELVAGGLWEPYYVPTAWVRIVHTDPLSSFVIKGMI